MKPKFAGYFTELNSNHPAYALRFKELSFSCMAPMTRILRTTKNLLISTLLLLATLLATGPYLSVGSISATSPIFRAFAGPLALLYQEPANVKNWRKTRKGWEESSKWVQAESIEYERKIELVHPLSVSGIILLSSIGMLIWASEEWDTERLFSSRENKNNANS